MQKKKKITTKYKANIRKISKSYFMVTTVTISSPTHYRNLIHTDLIDENTIDYNN